MTTLTDAPAPAAAAHRESAAGSAPADSDARFYRYSFAALIIGAVLALGVFGSVAYEGSVAQGDVVGTTLTP
ncbi:MAG TPA: hypothetical protein VFN19_04200 [Candidatus Nanopelagicales bacterium]|jgi:hypothetical protein|nr:hypothetical protein [Candidatus Nanopelagicales bacterium]